MGQEFFVPARTLIAVKPFKVFDQLGPYLCIGTNATPNNNNPF